MNKLKIMQKKAIRTICNVGFRDHTAPLFKELKILPLEQMKTLNILKFMHGFMHNLLPFSFRDAWITNRIRLPDRELRNADQLYIPPHSFATLKRLPLFNFPSVWNQADISKKNPNQIAYIKDLKKSLLLNVQ